METRHVQMAKTKLEDEDESTQHDEEKCVPVVAPEYVGVFIFRKSPDDDALARYVACLCLNLSILIISSCLDAIFFLSLCFFCTFLYTNFLTPAPV